jgi:hypothetical protein
VGFFFSGLPLLLIRLVLGNNFFRPGRVISSLKMPTARQFTNNNFRRPFWTPRPTKILVVPAVITLGFSFSLTLNL